MRTRLKSKCVVESSAAVPINPVEESKVSSTLPTTDAETISPTVASEAEVTPKMKHPRPDVSYVSIITEALEDAPNRRLILSELYKYFMKRYPYFRTAGSGWKNSIRHNLSLNKKFVRIPRNVRYGAANNKGSYWMLAEDVHNGMYMLQSDESPSSQIDDITVLPGTIAPPVIYNDQQYGYKTSAAVASIPAEPAPTITAFVGTKSFAQVPPNAVFQDQHEHIMPHVYPQLHAQQASSNQTVPFAFRDEWMSHTDISPNTLASFASTNYSQQQQFHHYHQNYQQSPSITSIDSNAMMGLPQFEPRSPQSDPCLSSEYIGSFGF